MTITIANGVPTDLERARMRIERLEVEVARLQAALRHIGIRSGVTTQLIEDIINAGAKGPIVWNGGHR